MRYPVASTNAPNASFVTDDSSISKAPSVTSCSEVTSATSPVVGKRRPPVSRRSSSLSQHSVRPKGLEPLTFWLVADQAERYAIDAAFFSIVRQVSPDARRDAFERVA